MANRFLIDGPDIGAAALLLAHGAGAPMDSPFMEAFAKLAAQQGVRVARFEFAYMAARRTTGKKAPPPRAEKLISEFEDALAEIECAPIFIGGKSLGGRVASMFAETAFAQGRINGLVCLGYPFHPPGKPDSLRTAHLVNFTCPTLIVQGENDPFGNRGEVTGYDLPESIRIAWAPYGNHDLAPPMRSGRTGEQNWQDAAAAVAGFMKENIC